MKTKLGIKLCALLASTALWAGCVVHEHHHHRRAYGYQQYPEYHHVHGPGCGHVLRGGVWIAVP